jgi:hypothetical protein
VTATASCRREAAFGKNWSSKVLLVADTLSRGRYPLRSAASAGVGRPLGRARGDVRRPAGHRQARRLGRREREGGRRRGVDRRRIDRPVGPDAAAQLEAGHPGGRAALEQRHARARELEHQLQRVGLHRGAETTRARATASCSSARRTRSAATALNSRSPITAK